MNKIRNLVRTIDPVKVAEKLEAVRNFVLPEIFDEIAQKPRLAEAMWFLAWVSLPENYHGGLTRFAVDFIAECSTEIGPRDLLDKGQRELSEKEIEGILGALPEDIADELTGDNSARRLLCGLLDGAGVLASEDARQVEALRRKTLCSLSYERLHTACINAAKAHLADFFFEICTNPEATFTGSISGPGGRILAFWPRLWDSFFAWRDRDAEKSRKAIAETSVTREIFRWLRLAEETRKGIMIVGNSRYGKTEAIRAYALMNLERARFIETPASGAEGDLLREIGRALGVNHRLNYQELRTAIDFVLRQSRIMLIFDEAQFLFPTHFSRRGDPPRLNYVRRSIMDLGLPTAFIYTPQSWKRVEKNYLKATGYTIEQFEGRLLRSEVVLPDELPRNEMIEVARIHFPELSNEHLDYIVRALRGILGSVLSSIENVSRLSRIYATESGHLTPRVSDIKRALLDVVPGTEPDSAPVPVVECKTPSRRSAVAGATRLVAPSSGNRLSVEALSAIG
ncbi:MAG TPA: AAA family ATPase [Terrimicrobiaceae bacterium]